MMKIILLRVLQTSLLISLSISSVNAATFATALGKDWRSMSDITDFSYDQIRVVCPTDGAACSGLLGSVDITGWIWASVEEVGALFNYETGGVHPGGVNAVWETDSAWAPAFVAKYGATGVTATLASTQGVSRTILSGQVKVPAIYDFLAAGSSDSANSTSFWNYTSNSHDRVGVWLNRPTVVPLPAAAWLFITAIGGLAVLKRKNA